MFVIKMITAPIGKKELWSVSVGTSVSHAEYTAAAVRQVGFEVVGERGAERWLAPFTRSCD